MLQFAHLDFNILSSMLQNHITINRLIEHKTKPNMLNKWRIVTKRQKMGWFHGIHLAAITDKLKRFVANNWAASGCVRHLCTLIRRHLFEVWKRTETSSFRKNVTWHQWKYTLWTLISNVWWLAGRVRMGGKNKFAAGAAIVGEFSLLSLEHLLPAV